MKIMDRLSRIFGSRKQTASELESHVLRPFEIRLIAEGKLDRLVEFAASSRLHATDLQGDTPLHFAARTGSLAVCDLFIRSGADPDALNHDRQTPAEVAFAEGHGLASQLLSSLAAPPRETETLSQSLGSLATETAVAGPDAIEDCRFTVIQKTEPTVRVDDLDDLLNFEAKAEPEEFFNYYAGATASGTFITLASPSPVVSDNEVGDWNLDLSPAPIAGEGIGSDTCTSITIDYGAENDFLKVRKSGRKSNKRAVVHTGTRMSIDPDFCVTWSEEILAKGCCSLNDINRLVDACEGNGDFEELRINLKRSLEAAGFDLEQATGQDMDLWYVISDISSDDLADAIEAALTRRTHLPGTQRFVMNKSGELQLLEPMIRAKQELQLSILSSETAVVTILDVMNSIRDGSRDPASVSLRTIIPSRQNHAETSNVMEAVDTLRSWHTSGRMLDGKQRRKALAALDALDLSLAFHKELFRRLQQFPSYQNEASTLKAEILVFEAVNERLIREHLPYVRRFASRNVVEGEDPEEVFQVAFIGLQRSTRRFNPELGYRFLIYATYWMRQAITRWRADEGAAIRIPVHRNEKITKLDRALDRLDVRVNAIISDYELADDLEWTIDEVREFRSIPREAEYPASISEWDNLLPEFSDADIVNQAETERIVAEALADLPERQADVIRMRFGIERETDMTLEEIGQIYGVTRERIRQIEAKALAHLAHPGRKKRLQTLLGM
ncbi:sigma-70 family RNA polymerase sigma factor [Novacetimonas hansenii]|uniref:sigma-70 family RNA polymerase sigma factor n=1 Tax=Novacetimonas hansenii TaxID=436 RepID=UPI00094FF119|nr:sigma-70 family RNA polymerase sigma factor [Novacetimonas hansenii]